MKRLSDGSDVLYVMDYDTRSQIFDACIASANAPFPGMIHGLQRYQDLGVSLSKVVLGVPWYGYRYPCENGTLPDARYCPIKGREFRGVNCSDAAGSEVGLSYIANLKANATVEGWDENMGAPWFNAINSDGIVEQIWYDDVESLRKKFRWAKENGVRGVGPYTFDYIFGLPDEQRARTSGHLRELRQRIDRWPAPYVQISPREWGL